VLALDSLATPDSFLFASGRWYDVAVLLAVAFVLFRYLLLKAPPAHVQASPAERRSAVGTLIRLNELERAGRFVRREMLAKLSKFQLPK
jgi:hypothetical protein